MKRSLGPTSAISLFQARLTAIEGQTRTARQSPVPCSANCPATEFGWCGYRLPANGPNPRHARRAGPRDRSASTIRAVRSEQQQQLFDLNAAAIALDGQLQIAHRRPLDAEKLSPKEQVDDQRNRCQPDSPEQHRVQKRRDCSWGGGLFLGLMVQMLQPLARVQVMAEPRRQFLVRPQEHVIDAAAATRFGDLRHEPLHGFAIGLAENPRFREELFGPFNIPEEDIVFKREVQFVFVEDLKDRGFRGLDTVTATDR